MVYVFVFVCICLFQRNMFAESCVYTPCFRPPNYSPSLFLSPLYVYIYIYICVCVYIYIYIYVCVCVYVLCIGTSNVVLFSTGL